MILVLSLYAVVTALLILNVGDGSWVFITLFAISVWIDPTLAFFILFLTQGLIEVGTKYRTPIPYKKGFKG